MPGAAHEKLQGELDIAAAAEESGDVAEAKGQKIVMKGSELTLPFWFYRSLDIPILVS